MHWDALNTVCSLYIEPTVQAIMAFLVWANEAGMVDNWHCHFTTFMVTSRTAIACSMVLIRLPIEWRNENAKQTSL